MPNQFSILTFILAKWRFKFWSLSQIRKFQRKSILKMVKFAISHSDFYKNFYKDKDINDFSNLPTTDKSIMMDNFTSFNTVGFKLEEVMSYCLRMEETRDFSQNYKNYTTGLSTGTSGSRGIEVASPKEVRTMQTVFLSRFPIPKKGKFHLAFILRVFSTGFDVNFGRYKVSYVSPLDTIENIIEKLNSLRSTALSSPPSMLKLLAEAKLNHSLHITPKTVVSYAEVLTEDVKALLENAFQTKIIEVYKCTEGFIGLPCKEGNLHINEDLTFIQVVDDNLNPIPDGTPGKVLITNLIKKTTPFIRYRLNDVITIDPNPCPCGSHFRVIKQIQGRADDIFLGQRTDNANSQLILPDYICRAIVTTSEYIREYRAVQISPILVKVSLELDKKFNSENVQQEISTNLTKKIKSVFQKHKCYEPTIQFEYTSLFHNFDKKLRRIVRDFKESEFFHK